MPNNPQRHFRFQVVVRRVNNSCGVYHQRIPLFLMQHAGFAYILRRSLRCPAPMLGLLAENGIPKRA
jgi:hypothetical protein